MPVRFGISPISWTNDDLPDTTVGLGWNSPAATRVFT